MALKVEMNRMTILDKLMEKKDLLIYIDCRIKHLEGEREKLLSSRLPELRDLMNERFRGRIMELQYLKKHIEDLKDQAKKYWRDCEETIGDLKDE